MRLLVANKRNFPIALDRKSLRNKGKLFSQYATLMRCVKENHSASIITMRNENFLMHEFLIFRLSRVGRHNDSHSGRLNL